MWVGVLAAAERWGVPPWEIAPGKGSAWWYVHWQQLEQLRHDMQESDRELARRMQS